MDQRPEQPPEGKLIEDAAGNLDISIREAARRADISYGRWRQIVKGYQNVSPGVYAPVRNAPAKTVARMAAVVGVLPAQLTEAGREDAARALEAMQRRDAAAAADTITVRRENPTPSPSEQLPPVLRVPDESALAPYLQAVTRDVWRAIGIDPGPGEPPEISEAMLAEIDAGKTAADLFGPQYERDAWVIKDWPPEWRLRLVAIFRHMRAEALGETGQADTGLKRGYSAAGYIS